MDDVYAINLAKTEIREAYNKANPDRLLAVVDEGLIDFSDHRQTGYSQCGKAALRAHLEALFCMGRTNVTVIVEQGSPENHWIRRKPPRCAHEANELFLNPHCTTRRGWGA